MRDILLRQEFNGEIPAGLDFQQRHLPAAQLDGAHPRGFGSFTRVLGDYVRERHVVPLPEAIRKMTLGLVRRWRTT